MENKDKREIVYYTEQHTMMTQDVEIFTHEKNCVDMLKEDLNEVTKRELFQTYYLHTLKNNVKIDGKHNYGDWNASIGDISNTTHYLEEIKSKLKNNIMLGDIEKNMKIIHKIAGLSIIEEEQTKPLYSEMVHAFVNLEKKLKM